MRFCAVRIAFYDLLLVIVQIIVGVWGWLARQRLSGKIVAAAGLPMIILCQRNFVSAVPASLLVLYRTRDSCALVKI